MVCIKNRYLRSCRYRFDGYQFSDPVSTKPNQFARQNGHFRAVASMTRTRSPSFSNHDRTTIQRFSPLLNCGSFIFPTHRRACYSHEPEYRNAGSTEPRPPLEKVMNAFIPARALWACRPGPAPNGFRTLPTQSCTPPAHTAASAGAAGAVVRRLSCSMRASTSSRRWLAQSLPIWQVPAYS